MKPITKEMIKIYNIEDFDFLGYMILKPKDLTYHHIKKKEHGGRETLSNGAILTKTSHQYIHLIQPLMPIIYDGLNIIMDEINKRGVLPTYEEMLIIDDLFRHFEYEHSSSMNHKNKPLIRKNYILQRKVQNGQY